MKQEEKTVYDFQKGDEITRLRPIVYEGADKDFALVGKKVTFLGIANASVYISKEADFFTTLLTGKDSFTMQIPIEICEDGWAVYVKPDFLNGEELSGKMDLSEEEKLEYEILMATENQEYEKAAILKKKLDNIKKEQDNGGEGN